ncbi:MAG: DUF3105 domain-containing protein [Chloroflexi bacterium]|nr:DUF3105 domain-containing protein [Chloroflexota bacterium]
MPVSRRRRGRAATRAARSGNLAPSNRRKKTNKLYLVASLVIAVLVIGSFALASGIGGGGGSSQTGNAAGYVSGVGVEVDIEGSTHVDEGEIVNYTTSPPASGNHWPVPAPCGFYTDPLPDERVVHNMEHGNIVISYNLPLEADVSALRDAVDDIGLNRVWGISRPYSGIEPGQVVLSTWGVMDSFLGVDKDRIETFFETYSGVMGPERVPC